MQTKVVTEEQLIYVQGFLKELDEIYKKYNMSISPENREVEFVIEEYRKDNVEHLSEGIISLYNFENDTLYERNLKYDES